MADIFFVFLSVLTSWAQAQVIPFQQPQILTIAQETPQVVTTIIDNTVSNTLANALQLLIVSNLIQNTINNPCANTLAANIGCDLPNIYSLDSITAEYLNPYTISNYEPAIIDILPSYQELPFNNYGYTNGMPNSGYASVCTQSSGCQNVAFEVLPNGPISPIVTYADVGIPNAGYAGVCAPNFGCQNVAYDVVPNYGINPIFDGIGPVVTTIDVGPNIGYSYPVNCQSVGYEIVPNVGPNVCTYDGPIQTIGTEVILPGPGQVGCGCGPNMPYGLNLPYGPNLPCGPNIEPWSLLQTYASRYLGNNFNF